MVMPVSGHSPTLPMLTQYAVGVAKAARGFAARWANPNQQGQKIPSLIPLCEESRDTHARLRAITSRVPNSDDFALRAINRRDSAENGGLDVFKSISVALSNVGQVRSNLELGRSIDSLTSNPVALWLVNKLYAPGTISDVVTRLMTTKSIVLASNLLEGVTNAVRIFPPLVTAIQTHANIKVARAHEPQLQSESDRSHHKIVQSVLTTRFHEALGRALYCGGTIFGAGVQLLTDNPELYLGSYFAAVSALMYGYANGVLNVAPTQTVAGLEYVTQEHCTYNIKPALVRTHVVQDELRLAISRTLDPPQIYRVKTAIRALSILHEMTVLRSHMDSSQKFEIAVQSKEIVCLTAVVDLLREFERKYLSGNLSESEILDVEKLLTKCTKYMNGGGEFSRLACDLLRSDKTAYYLHAMYRLGHVLDPKTIMRGETAPKTNPQEQKLALLAYDRLKHAYLSGNIPPDELVDNLQAELTSIIQAPSVTNAFSWYCRDIQRTLTQSCDLDRDTVRTESQLQRAIRLRQEIDTAVLAITNDADQTETQLRDLSHKLAMLKYAHPTFLTTVAARVKVLFSRQLPTQTEVELLDEILQITTAFYERVSGHLSTLDVVRNRTRTGRARGNDAALVLDDLVGTEDEGHLEDYSPPIGILNGMRSARKASPGALPTVAAVKETEGLMKLGLNLVFFASACYTFAELGLAPHVLESVMGSSSTDPDYLTKIQLVQSQLRGSVLIPLGLEGALVLFAGTVTAVNIKLDKSKQTMANVLAGLGIASTMESMARPFGELLLAGVRIYNSIRLTRELETRRQ